MNYLALKRRCELEEQISQRIYTDNSATTHFDYQNIPNHSNHRQDKVLTLITSNPVHKELFSLYTTQAHPTETECLDEVISYLDQIQQNDSGYFNYKIEWFRSNNSNEKFTSYFTGQNFKEIVDKFFENKNPDDFIIVSMQMSAIS